MSKSVDKGVCLVSWSLQCLVVGRLTTNYCLVFHVAAQLCAGGEGQQVRDLGPGFLSDISVRVMNHVWSVFPGGNNKQ